MSQKSTLPFQTQFQLQLYLLVKTTNKTPFSNHLLLFCFLLLTLCLLTSVVLSTLLLTTRYLLTLYFTNYPLLTRH